MNNRHTYRRTGTPWVVLTLIKSTYYQQPRNSAEEEGVSWSLWEVSVQGSHRVPASWSRKLGLFLHTLSTSEHGPKEVFASSLSLTGGRLGQSSWFWNTGSLTLPGPCQQYTFTRDFIHSPPFVTPREDWIKVLKVRFLSKILP